MGNYDYIKALDTYKQFIAEIDNDHLFHSILLINNDGEFLNEYARSLAGEILSKDYPQRKQNIMERVWVGVHPDCMIYGQAKPLDADGVRGLLDTVYVAPYEGTKKVYIIYNFDCIGTTVANKLLKTLEEPTAGTVFLLLAKNENKILSTLLSRSLKFYVEGYSAKIIERELTEKNIKNPELLAMESNYNLEDAKKLSEKINPSELANFVVDVLTKLNVTSDLVKITAKSGVATDSVTEFFGLVSNLCMSAIKYKAGVVDNSETKSTGKTVKIIADNWTINALALIIEATTDALKKNDANVSTVNIMDQFLLKILEVKRKCNT